MRVLLVEDSPRLRKSLVTALKASGYAVDAADNGEDGLWLARTHDYDAVVLDIMIPRLDGMQVLEQLRKAGKKMPVLFLTAKDAVADRVSGLRQGADDYLVKPFALEELLARVETLCRRNYHQPSSILAVDDLALDSATKTVIRAGLSVELAAREFALLEYLLLRKDQVVSRREIEEHIYDDLVSPMSNVVDAAIYTLRRKLSTHPEARPLIETRRGQGYVIRSSKDSV